MISEAALMALREVTAVRIDEPMARHTTFGVGGPADGYAVAHSAAELKSLVRVARRHGTPVFVFGAGSNIVVADGGIRGLSIQNDSAAVEGPLAEGTAYVVRAESGVSFAGIARKLSLAGWAGIEWAAGIPGSLGGAVISNAGAYGRCFADVLRRVTVLDERSEERDIDVAELDLTYRGSAFVRGPLAGKIVLSVVFAVTAGDAERLAKLVAGYDEQRLAAQPRGRNSGSMFKNDANYAAWQLIESAGLRGYRIGDTQISPKHTNFFLNKGHATAADVRALMDLATRTVRERFGIELEPEVALVGDWGAA